jgi:hypothetical protein
LRRNRKNPDFGKKNMEIVKSCKVITETELSLFESALKVKLPEDYRQFLLTHNGGSPRPSCFRVNIDGFESITAIERILCLDPEERYSLQKYLNIYKNRIPSNLLPIATELSVDLICLSVSGDDYGTIYLWDHNWEVTESKPDYSNVHYLAASFSKLLDMLYSEGIED